MRIVKTSVTQKDKQVGFTLVEIILSLGLTALLLGLLSSGVYIVADDWNRNSDVLDRGLDQALAVLQIDRALQGAFPHSYTNFDTLGREIYFHGEDDYLSFVSAVSPQRSPGLTVWEMYSVANEGVYLSLVPAFSDNPTQRLSESEPLLVLENYTAEFSYLYQDLNENRLWIDEWLGEEELSLPLAVYVRFVPERDVEDVNEELEIVARIKNNQHRSIRPTTNTGL
jgi:general secretion pathway protein J